MAHVIGIDLGTTYSSLGVYRNGRIEIVPDEYGKSSTPSCVMLTDSERLVGRESRRCPDRPENTIFNAKRLLGRQYYDKSVRSDLKHWPFTVTNEDGKPSLLIDYEKELKTLSYSPEEVSAMILTKLKEVAEAYLGEPVKDAVISVPAYFNDAQRQATKNAGIIAGLNVVRIINDPTAAALAYTVETKTQTIDEETNLLIFDLGGGALDVSVVTVKGKKISVRSTAGDTHLGGEDFNHRLENYFSAQFKRKYKQDLTSDSEALRRLRAACETAKRTLSSSSEANITLSGLYDGKDFQSTITKTRFEELCSDLFKRIVQQVGKALKGAGLDNHGIHEVVLVGESTRIPKIQKILAEKMGTKLNVCPEKAVAKGAAYQAAILSRVEDPVLKDMVVEDVLPRSIGIPSSTGALTHIIDRNTKIPHKATKTFTTYHDNQPVVAIQVYEGDKSLTKENHHLGTFYLTDIPPAPRGEPQLHVCFEVDSSGILTISPETSTLTEEDHPQGPPRVTCAKDGARLSPDELKRIVKKSTEFQVTRTTPVRNSLKRKIRPS